MIRYLLGRVAWALGTLLVFVSVVFVLVNVLIPYDYATFFWLQGGESLVETMREQMGLDRSLWERYLDQLGGIFQFDLGTSFSGEPVTRVVAEALPVTVLSFALGGVVAYLFGDWIGRVVSWRRRRWLSASATSASVGLYTAFPPLLVFILMYFAIRPLRDARQAVGLPSDSADVWSASTATESQVMIILAGSIILAIVVALLVRGMARRRGMRVLGGLALPLSLGGAAVAIVALGLSSQTLEVLFRVTGVGSAQAANPLGVGSGRFGNLLVAALALMLIAFGEVALVVKAGMDEESGEDYVLTARAKGLRDSDIRDHHVGRNAVLPVLSRVVIGVPYLLSGLIIIERELQLSGVSSVFFEAISRVDVPLIIGVLIVIGILVLAVRLVLDVLHSALDPRIRLAADKQ